MRREISLTNNIMETFNRAFDSLYSGNNMMEDYFSNYGLGFHGLRLPEIQTIDQAYVAKYMRNLIINGLCISISYDNIFSPKKRYLKFFYQNCMIVFLFQSTIINNNGKIIPHRYQVKISTIRQEREFLIYYENLIFMEKNINGFKNFLQKIRRVPQNKIDDTVSELRKKVNLAISKTYYRSLQFNEDSGTFEVIRSKGNYDILDEDIIKIMQAIYNFDYEMM
jgi:hypothetical protein